MAFFIVCNSISVNSNFYLGINTVPVMLSKLSTIAYFFYFSVVSMCNEGSSFIKAGNLVILTTVGKPYAYIY